MWRFRAIVLYCPWVRVMNKKNLTVKEAGETSVSNRPLRLGSYPAGSNLTGRGVKSKEGKSMTNKTKPQAPTPGPWEQTTRGNGKVSIRARFCTIATVEAGENFANARLIAASPTMYDFIKRLADLPCDDLPGEYPEKGESGHAPCLNCEAKKLLNKAGL